MKPESKQYVNTTICKMQKAGKSIICKNMCTQLKGIWVVSEDDRIELLHEIGFLVFVSI